mgnify:FL=1
MDGQNAAVTTTSDCETLKMYAETLSEPITEIPTELVILESKVILENDPDNMEDEEESEKATLEGKLTAVAEEEFSVVTDPEELEEITFEELGETGTTDEEGEGAGMSTENWTSITSSEEVTERIESETEKTTSGEDSSESLLIAKLVE